MLLTQDQEMIRDAVRDFAQTELWPHAARWDKEHHFPKEAHQGLAALGAYGICVPEEFGGAHLDYVTLALVLEEIAAAGTTRFMIITHHRMTMARMDRLFGVTMAERGVSRLVSVDLQRAAELAETA